MWAGAGFGVERTDGIYAADTNGTLINEFLDERSRLSGQLVVPWRAFIGRDGWRFNISQRIASDAQMLGGSSERRSGSSIYRLVDWA